MIIGSYVEHPIGAIITVWQVNTGPRAKAMVLREATYEEWLKCLHEFGLEEINVDKGRKTWFYEVHVD